MTVKAVIFDLDGVLTDTAEFHYRSWQRLADEEGFAFSRDKNEQLRGVSRQRSLELILEGQAAVEQGRFAEMLDRKNRYYQEMLTQIDHGHLLPGIPELLDALRQAGVRVAVGSASKNARPVLEALGIAAQFDVIADGYSVAQAKPAPDLFFVGGQPDGDRAARVRRRGGCGKRGGCGADRRLRDRRDWTRDARGARPPPPARHQRPDAGAAERGAAARRHLARRAGAVAPRRHAPHGNRLHPRQWAARHARHLRGGGQRRAAQHLRAWHLRRCDHRLHRACQRPRLAGDGHSLGGRAFSHGGRHAAGLPADAPPSLRPVDAHRSLGEPWRQAHAAPLRALHEHGDPHPARHPCPDRPRKLVRPRRGARRPLRAHRQSGGGPLGHGGAGRRGGDDLAPQPHARHQA